MGLEEPILEGVGQATLVGKHFISPRGNVAHPSHRVSMLPVWYQMLLRRCGAKMLSTADNGYRVGNKDV